ncbi:MAG: hypothetical protein AAFQ40_09455, partial [Cyanobacteria bacterium J06623_5]
METRLLRTIWSVIEQTPAYYLQQVSSHEQVRLLLKRIEDEVILSPPERAEARKYLSDRGTLIREMSLEQVM